jgi:lysophospholipase L1-like esterase
MTFKALPSTAVAATTGISGPFLGRGLPMFNRTHIPGQNAAVAQPVAQRTFRVKHTAKVAGAIVRLVYDNFDKDSSEGLGATNPITIRASFESVLGTPYPVRFNGARDITIEANGYVVSDPIGVHVAAGDALYSRTAVTVATPGTDKVNVGGVAGQASLNEGQIDGDGTLTASPTLVTGLNMYAPLAVLLERPTSPARSAVVIGNSIATGQGDTASLGDHRGFPARALDATNIGEVRLSVGGSLVSVFAPRTGSSRQRRWSMVPGMGNLLIFHGTNDLQTRTSAQIWADLQTVCQDARALGCKVLACTVPPLADSTDGFTTDANQTVQSTVGENTRLAVNALLRGALPSWIDAVFDTAAAVESTTFPGHWKAGMTSDGTHNNPNGHIAMATMIDPTKFA